MPESATWVWEQLEALGVGNSALARAMIENGDGRQFATVVRGLQRMATGKAPERPGSAAGCTPC